METNAGGFGEGRGIQLPNAAEYDWEGQPVDRSIREVFYFVETAASTYLAFRTRWPEIEGMRLEERLSHFLMNKSTVTTIVYA